MIDVKKPVLLDGSLQPVRVLEPHNVAITLNSPGISQATIVLGPDDPEPAMHAWVELFNQKGSVGIFRVSVPTQDYTQQQSIVLRHGIDSLADSHYIGQVDFDGSVQTLISTLLTFQTTRINGQAPWQLGTCQCSATKKYSINYDRLSDLLAKIEEEESDYYFSYDQSSFPWTINFLLKPTEADAGFRLSRNVRTISRTLNDNDLCTQLILSVSVATTDEATGSGITPGDPEYEPTPGETDADITGITATSTTTETAIRVYDNAAAQAIYGIVQRTADIDTHDHIAGGSFPEADAWAARFLAQHAAPTMQLQIDGDELKALTGDSWDEAKLGHICRVELPEHNQSFAQRVVSVSYPEALSDPRHVTVSLATQLPKFSSSIASLKEQSAANAAASRSISRSAASAKEMKAWSMVVTDQQLALDGTGIMQLYESGIDMDAKGGVKIYSLAQGVQSLYSGINVQAGRIDLVVTGEGTSASINIEAIVDGVNKSQVSINADRIKLNGKTIVGNVQDLGYALTVDNADISRMILRGTNGNALDCYGRIYMVDTYLGLDSDSYMYAPSASFDEIYIGGGTGFRAGTDISTVIISSIGPASESNGQITIPFSFYDGTAGTPINFNIAATQFYINGVAAADNAGYARGETQGWNSCAGGIDLIWQLAGTNTYQPFATGSVIEMTTWQPGDYYICGGYSDNGTWKPINNGNCGRWFRIT